MFEITESHRYSILTDTTSMLGELHWYLLRSSKLISDEQDTPKLRKRTELAIAAAQTLRTTVL